MSTGILPLSLAGIAANLVHEQSLAERSNIQSSRAPGEWISGGVNKQVVVCGQPVRVDSKLPGEVHYRFVHVALCKGGNIVKL
jgi:hypothetical protein